MDVILIFGNLWGGLQMGVWLVIIWVSFLFWKLFLYLEFVGFFFFLEIESEGSDCSLLLLILLWFKWKGIGMLSGLFMNNDGNFDYDDLWN